MTLADARKQLDESCEATRDLYLYMLAIIPELTAEAAARIEAARNKFNPTHEELNPNEKFAGNALSGMISEDPDFSKILSRKKLSWEGYDLIVKRMLDSIVAKQYYADYMSSPSSSLKEDCRLFCKIYEEEFSDDDDLRAMLDDKSIYWVDDLEYALTWDCKSLNYMAAGNPWRLPELYQSDEIARERGAELSSDKDFVHKLLRTAMSGYDKYFGQIKDSVTDWDESRLFSTDVTAIVLGLAESESFPDIPARVTLNEWIEISKFYCAPGSHQFVNGVLDKLMRQNNKQITERL